MDESFGTDDEEEGEEKEQNEDQENEDEDTFGEEEEDELSASDNEPTATATAKDAKDDFRLTDESEHGAESTEENGRHVKNGSTVHKSVNDEFLSDDSSCASSNGDDSLDDQFALDLERDLFNKKN